jgi:hypothetical protein
MSKYVIYYPLYVAVIEVIINSIFSSNIDHFALFLIHLGITLFITVISTVTVVNIFKLKNDELTRKVKSITKITLFFIFIMMLSIFRSSDLIYSFTNVLRFSICLLAFPVSTYYFLKNPNEIKRYFKYVVIGSTLYLIAIPIFSLFKIGSHLDGEYGRGVRNLIYGGGIGFYNIYPAVYMTIVGCLYFFIGNKNFKTGKLFKNNWLKYVYLSISLGFLVVLFLITKRDYLIMIVLSFSTFLVIYNKLSIRKYVPYAVFILSVYFLGSVSGFNTVVANQFLEVRNIENKPLILEGRVLEYVDWFYNLSYNPDWDFILFGKEIFNSRGKFFQTSLILPDRDRVLHSEITHILYGIGVIGLAIYAFYLFSIFYKVYGFRRLRTLNQEGDFFWAMFLSIYITNLAVNFSGGLFRTFDKLIQYQMMGVFFAMIIILSNMPTNQSMIKIKLEREKSES